MSERERVKGLSFEFMLGDGLMFDRVVMVSVCDGWVCLMFLLFLFLGYIEVVCIWLINGWGVL